MINHASNGQIRMNEGNIHLRMLPAIHTENLVGKALSDGLDLRKVENDTREAIESTQKSARLGAGYERHVCRIPAVNQMNDRYDGLVKGKALTIAVLPEYLIYGRGVILRQFHGNPRPP